VRGKRGGRGVGRAAATASSIATPQSQFHVVVGLQREDPAKRRKRGKERDRRKERKKKKKKKIPLIYIDCHYITVMSSTSLLIPKSIAPAATKNEGKKHREGEEKEGSTSDRVQSSLPELLHRRSV